MSKQVGQITFTETEDGFRIDVSGKSLKDMCNCGCVPFFGHGAMPVVCCAPASDKSDCREDKK